MPEPPDPLREEWMRAVVKRWEGALLGYAERLVGKAAAQDVVQETFLGLWRSGPVETPAVDLRGYVYRSCRNQCVDFLRAKQGHQRRVASASVIEPPGFAARAQQAEESRFQTRDRLNRVLDRIRRLPAQHQEVLRLKLVDGLTYEEIARVIGVPTGTVGWIIHEALKATRAGLK